MQELKKVEKPVVAGKPSEDTLKPVSQLQVIAEATGLSVSDLQSLKAKFGSVFVLEFDDMVALYRPIFRNEWESINRKIINEAELAQQRGEMINTEAAFNNEMVRTCVIYPSMNDPNTNVRAGTVSTLANLITYKSNFLSLDYALERTFEL